ncbi:hypothetical protein BDV93DRAFT_611985 [Ceratobasidium sp. AG-I]|nr:hypothetical protein BDV93DRAFT_611985 [Ceratobasidium sp. AG-I]
MPEFTAQQLLAFNQIPDSINQWVTKFWDQVGPAGPFGPPKEVGITDQLMLALAKYGGITVTPTKPNTEKAEGHDFYVDYRDPSNQLHRCYLQAKVMDGEVDYLADFDNIRKGFDSAQYKAAKDVYENYEKSLKNRTGNIEWEKGYLAELKQRVDDFKFLLMQADRLHKTIATAQSLKINGEKVIVKGGYIVYGKLNMDYVPIGRIYDAFKSNNHTDRTTADINTGMNKAIQRSPFYGIFKDITDVPVYAERWV